MNSIMILTIILGAINFPKYALQTDEYYDTVVMQAYNYEGEVSMIADNIITQTFTTNKEFNSISIKFSKKDITSTTHYYIEITNSKGDIVAKKKFSSDEISDNSYKTINFNYVEPKENEEYTIKIYSEDATEENSIGIPTYELDNYDVYLDGILKINDKETNGDITFKVQNVRERTYVSKKIYIIMFVMIIAIEIFVFYPYIKWSNNKHKLIEI